MTTPVAPDLPLAQRLDALWAEIAGWVSSHTGLIATSIVLGAGVVAVLYGLKLFGVWLCRPGRSANGWVETLGKTLSRTRIWFMVAVAAQLIAWLGRAPVEVAWPIKAAFVCAAGLQAAVWVRAFLLGIIAIRAREADPHDTLQSAVGLIRLLVTAALFILAAILILANLGVDVTGLLAGLGIGGIAIGLAAQGIFSDLFAALTILFDKPFRKGDLIRWETSAGEVEYIGLKSSRIRALSGEEIIISNANLLGKELRNFARLERRRITQTLSLVYHTPIELCGKVDTILESAINACDGATFVRCGLDTFAPSSLDFTLIYDIDADEQALVLARKHAVNVAVLRCFADIGIAFAYPTQTTYTAAPDGTLVMPYAQPSDGNIVKR